MWVWGIKLGSSCLQGSSLPTQLFPQPIILVSRQTRAGEITERLKPLVAAPDDLSSTPGTHMKEEEYSGLEVDL